MSKFQSVKVIDGFSTVFRQHKALTTHCSFQHGYDIEFKLTFEGELDNRNWVFDFGGLKRANCKIDNMNPSDWFQYMFDHTTILSEDDPCLEIYKNLEENKACRLRILPQVGCEKFAEYVFNKINFFLAEETSGRVKCIEVECREHNKNSAIYKA